jgi:hypothetical protein
MKRGSSKKFGANPSETLINIEKVWRKMIVKGKYKYEYSTVNLRVSVAKRFRLFSKKIAKSHSMTLSVIMDFFEWHGFLPSDRFERSIIQELAKNRKRTEASIAIIRDIEKHQTKPTNAMLLSLFEENLTQGLEHESDMVEKKFADKVIEEKPIQGTTVPKIRYKRLEEKMDLVKADFTYVLEKVKVVKGGFGKGYLKLELTEVELIKFKRTLKNR